MHQVGTPVNLHIDGPFYVGIGFCSHVPDKSDTAVLSNVVLENSAGKGPLNFLITSNKNTKFCRYFGFGILTLNVPAT